MKSTRRVLSLVLAMLMLFSMFTVAASAENIDVAETGVTMTGGEVLYLMPNSNWTQAGARFACYFFGTTNTWASMEACERDAGYYKVTVPSGSWTNVIFCRMNPATTENNWTNKWNQTGDLVYDGTNNLCTINSGQWDCGMNVKWSVFTETADETTPETEPETVPETEPETKPEATGDQPTVPPVTEPETAPETEPETVDTTEYIDVYFQNNWLWTDICVHYWDSATAADTVWPGEAMDFYENDGNYDVYTAKVPKDVKGLIINGIKDDGSGSRDQSPNIEEGFYDGVCYYMKWDNGNQVGSQDITVIFPPATEPTEPETQPETTPETAPETEPETVPETEPETVPETEPATDNESTGDQPETEPTKIPAGYYLVGTLNGTDMWYVDADAADRMFKANENADGEYTLDYTFTKGDEVKVVYFNGEKIEKWFNDGGENYGIGEAKVGDTTVYFRPDGNSDWSYYYFTIIPKEVPPTEKPTDNEATGDQPTVPPVTEPETEPETEDTVEYITVYFQNNWLWSNVSIHFWGSEQLADTEWPGTEMEFYNNDGNYDVYFAKIPNDIKGLIINGLKDDGSGNRDQSPNIVEGFYDGVCYYMTWDNGNQVGSQDITVIFPPATEPTEPETQPETTPETTPETQPDTEPTEPETQPEVKKVENVNCTDVTRKTFTVNWDAFEGAEKYWVYIDDVMYGSTTETSLTVAGRTSGVTYDVQVIASLADGTTLDLNAADRVEVTALNKTENVQVVDVTAFEIEISWDETVGATKYWVYTNDGAYMSTEETSMVITKRVPETLYNIYVVAVFEDNFMFSKADADVVTVTTADLGPVTSTTRYDFPLTDEVKDSDKAWLLYGKTADKQAVFNTVDLTKDTFTIANLDYDTDYYYSYMYMKDGRAITTETYVAHTEANPTYNAITATVNEDGKLVLNWNQVNQTYKYWVFRNGALVAWPEGETTLTFDEYDLSDEFYIEGTYRYQYGTRQVKYQTVTLGDILA